MSTSRKFRIVVPTRDSARWVATFAQAYRAVGIEPLYLYDTRSTDDTLGELMRVGAEIRQVTPAHSRVEAMLQFVPEVIETDWVVRLDDDEFPSIELIDWLDRYLPGVDCPALALSRRELAFVEGQLRYTRLEDYYFNPRDPTYLGPQWRAFMPKQVRFRDMIHTPGIDLQAWDAVPPHAYFVHLDFIVRTFNERIAKMRRYEMQAPGAGWAFAQFYLPEVHVQEDLRWTGLETDQFDQLARKVQALAAQ